MDENNGRVSPQREGDVTEPESPKSFAFTIDFGDGKVDNQRHKSLVEKYQKRHRRGQSLSKLEDVSPTVVAKKHPLSANLPRKSSFQSEGYFSSDERHERNKNVRATANSLKIRDSLTLPLRNVPVDKMTQSCTLPSIASPEIESKNVVQNQLSPDGEDIEFDKSDSVSDTGTYTLDAENYSEEQKARMSIDREFKLEQVSVSKKTEEYVRSLLSPKVETTKVETSPKVEATIKVAPKVEMTPKVETTTKVNVSDIRKPQTLDLVTNVQKMAKTFEKHRILSPILSPTQNLSITQNKSVREEVKEVKQLNNGEDDFHNRSFTKILFPSPKARTGIGSEPAMDQGSVISVTSSGAFRSKSEKQRRHARQLSLTKSEVHVEAYTDNNYQNELVVHAALTLNKSNGANLTANVIHVAESVPKSTNVGVKKSPEFDAINDVNVVSANITIGKVTNLPPAIGGVSGKTSPTKIPSPIHTSRPRSRDSVSSLNIDLSDSSLETESYLKPTQNIINSLQQRLSLDSDHDAENEKYLNNDARNLLKKASHLRHNSFDDKNLKISNKLEHFQNKNLQGHLNKIQNSPNNSPIKRSSSFSTKNQNNVAKSSNLNKETNLINSPCFNRNASSIQRSASTASIKPNLLQQIRRSSISDHQKIDRNQFGDTESSSEDDFDKLPKKKDITNTRYNRAFSLRRGRLEAEPPAQPKCPNTPEMRRKFQPNEARIERAISVDRRPMKANDVQSRYLQSIAKKCAPAPTPPQHHGRPELPKSATRSAPKIVNKVPVFSRTDTGRFSVRNSKPVANNTRKDTGGKKQSGGRSNSSLSSREVEFQNWKRRKSYDPMKAAAEGKRKAEMAKRQTSMTQSYTEANQDCDSSPSHSSSVHRSQSFHGTAALEQLISSDEDDQTLSGDEGFSPPTPSPCDLSPAKASLKYAWRDHHVMH